MSIRETIARNYTRWMRRAIPLASSIHPDITRDDAEDIYQDVIEYLLDNAGNLEKLTDSFVLELVKNRTLNWIKSHKHTEPLTTPEDDPSGECCETLPDALIERLTPEQQHVDKARLNENRRALSSAIQSLTDKQRQIIGLRYWDGFVQEQVANIMGVTQQDVDAIEKRALAMLRKCMNWNNPTNGSCKNSP